jgi:hypothetical protein
MADQEQDSSDAKAMNGGIVYCERSDEPLD